METLDAMFLNIKMRSVGFNGETTRTVDIIPIGIIQRVVYYWYLLVSAPDKK